MHTVPCVIGVTKLLSPCQVGYIGYQTQLFNPNTVVIGTNSISIPSRAFGCTRLRNGWLRGVSYRWRPACQCSVDELGFFL